MSRRHVVAGGDFSARDAAVDRRQHAREAHIQRRRGDRRLCRLEVGLVLAAAADALIIFLTRDRFGFKQGFCARQLAAGQCVLRPRTIQFGTCLIQRGLIRPRIDLEQHLALFHQGAFGEADRVDIAGNTRLEFNAFHGLEAPGEGIPVRHFTSDDLADRDRGRWRYGAVLGMRLAATTEHCEQCESAQYGSGFQQNPHQFARL